MQLPLARWCELVSATESSNMEPSTSLHGPTQNRVFQRPSHTTPPSGLILNPESVQKRAYFIRLRDVLCFGSVSVCFRSSTDMCADSCLATFWPRTFGLESGMQTALCFFLTIHEMFEDARMSSSGSLHCR